MRWRCLPGPAAIGFAAALAGAALAAGVSAGGARAERLVLSLSSNEIAIGSNYTGARLVVFGIVERDGQAVSRGDERDVVVTVRGPREATTVRRKGALGPIWLNRDQQKFARIPSYLAVLTTRPLAESVPEPLRRKHRLGIDAIVGAPEFTIDRGGEDEPFRAALVRLKAREGLYLEQPRGVTFVSGEFFRAAVPLPGVAPTGNYDVEVELLSGGVPIARRAASFSVAKVGLEQTLTELAHENGLVLGLTTAGLSLLFGWLASVIFRRD